jgi:ABC-type phosphate transport system permease subunit
MAYVWLLAVPLAIGLAVYGKLFNKNWWGKAHMWIMSIGVIVPLTVAGILGFTASETLKLRPHTVKSCPFMK